MSDAIVSVLVALALSGGVVALAIRSNVLRDPSTARRPPFSFSRVQLLWWVLVIAFCFLKHFAQAIIAGHWVKLLPDLNSTCLILLGIGVGTTTLAQVMDGRQRQAADQHGTSMSQDAESQGFLTDILSDDNGVSVHRLQALVFNLIYGVAFVASFLSTAVFQEYGKFEFGVLGLSNAGYLGLKALENNPQTRTAMGTGSAGGDFLTDADATTIGSTAVG
jgi:hypothetical protein